MLLSVLFIIFRKTDSVESLDYKIVQIETTMRYACHRLKGLHAAQVPP
jgi:hypothetical protein